MYLSFIKPWYLEARDIYAEAIGYEEAALKYEEYSRLLNNKAQTIRDLTPRTKDRINQVVPVGIDEIRILLDLQNITKEEQMLFGNVDVEVSEDTSFPLQTGDAIQVDVINVSFDAIGTYEQFKTLLQRLESSLTLFEVTEISFSAPEEASPFQQFSLSVRTHVLKQK